MTEITTGQGQTRTEHRYLSARLVVTGQLELTSLAHFGNGDADAWTDLPLLLDETDSRALITGASLAGALRNHLREVEWGHECAYPSKNPQAVEYEYGVWNEAKLLASHLFGGHRGDPRGEQSPLIVDDALSVDAGYPAMELRDGVKLDARTRTAADKKKYDYQLLRAGTCFNLRFELLLDDDAGKNKLRKRALALALGALQRGEIRLGARKRRGFGRCRVTAWTVTAFDLHDPQGLLAWLLSDDCSLGKPQEWKAKHKLENRPQPTSGPDIAELLGVTADDDAVTDRREEFVIEADFEVAGSLLVRSGFSGRAEWLDDRGDERPQVQGPDVVHLQSWAHETGQFQPVLPGTSLAGAIRQRAQRIANTLAGEGRDDWAQDFIDEMFGPAEIKSGDDLRASRVLVDEQFIADGCDLVQTRIKIDRFTSATMETALLEEAPHFGGRVRIRLMLRNPADEEIGLLLLVLKDLWLGDLPLGGEASVGRGRLRGLSATLTRTGRPSITLGDPARDGRVAFTDESDALTLEAYVQALHTALPEVKP